MPETNELRFRNYIDKPRVKAVYARALRKALQNAAPPDITPRESAALGVVVRTATEVEDILALRRRASPERIGDLRSEHAAAWGGLKGVIEGISRMPSEHSDRGPRAAALHIIVFPEGLAFVNEEASIAWSIAIRRLEDIAAASKRDELEQLAGADLVAYAEHTTRALGEALGLGEARRAPTPALLIEKRRAFNRAIGSYCRILSASVDDDNPASIERFRSAVAPLDEYRSANGSRADEEEDEEEIVTPPAPPSPEPTTP